MTAPLTFQLEWTICEPLKPGEVLRRVSPARNCWSPKKGKNRDKSS